ncbi:outer membrane beta-barrel protein [Carboxylicivirga sp. N1Y90]|uniref:outer membrane beta-barrel protein n=1 Tax=Carboxylicivirga fragile TaxID=3417571 RepID=UPI003D33AAA5|nr:hypothetical protein [Marinilabiliaceae bacterium N1Y90]
MPIVLRYIIVTLVFCSLVSESTAQRRRKSTIWEGVRVTPRVGVNVFFGDLVDKSRTSYSFGGVAEKELTPYLSARVQLMAGNMKGEQTYADTDELYTYFSNFYTDFMVGASFRPLDLALGYFKQRSFNPYIVGQVGIIYHSTDTHYGPHGFDPNTLRHSVSGVSPSFGAGVGLSYWLNSRMNVNVEFIGALPFTDMIDGHKEWYSGTPGNIVKVNETDPFDAYYTASVGVSFLLNDSKWKNEPKYNRKAYMKTRKMMMSSGSKKNQKSINRRRKKSRKK